ncbi:SCO6745 family protein [Amycolatopsis sp. WGS_07]|uniref:SCO6745 family protein n=1 Tax=Amycolatopsis sp. WGS_07 TaxID=3076764 RepID=UPI003872E4AB
MKPNPARSLWTAFEPLHAVVYFAPEPAAAAKEVGLRGWWMGYFAGRAAPLGPIGPEPVTSMFFGFAPRMVARALPDAWAFASAEDVLRTRVEATEAALTRLLGPLDSDAVNELATLLEQAVAGCRFDGRPLAAAWSAVKSPDRPLARLWLATAVLREHRGDGHVLAAVAAGLTGLEASLTHIASGATTREQVQRARGWTDEEWSAATKRLTDRGLIDEDGLTPAGTEVRRTIEETTDRLAADPFEALGPAGIDRVLDLAAPLSRKIIDNGGLPIPNPMGAIRP